MSDRKNSRVHARFQPKVPEALEYSVAMLAGTEADFVYVRKMDDDEPYPGEWLLRPEDPRFGGYIIPESDLDVVVSKQSVDSH